MKNNQNERAEEYAIFNKLIENSNLLTPKIKVTNTNKREILLISFIGIIRGHTKAIHLLIQEELPNQAYALVRPLLESVLRMRYMYHIMSDEAIEKIYTTQKWNNIFPNLGKMAEDIDRKLDVDSFKQMIDSVKTSHDYTHTGLTQISLNFNKKFSAVTGCQDNKRQIEVLRISNIMLFQSLILFFEDIGLKNLDITKEELNTFYNRD